MKKVTCHLFHEPVDIINALIAVASQDGCDGPEYDLMIEAADRIRFIEDNRDSWSPIEIAPKNGEFIIASDGYDQYIVRWIDPLDEDNQFSNKKQWCIDGFKCGWLSVRAILTHWMKLHDPPK